MTMEYKQPKLVKCVVCGTEFDANTRNFGKGKQMYCGQKCRQQADNRRHWVRKNPPKSEVELRRKCVMCEIEFVADKHHPNALTCSVKCSQARMDAERRRAAAGRYDLQPEMECAECGTKFVIGKYSALTGPRAPKYCSQKCGNRAAQRAFYQRNSRKYDPRLISRAWKDAKAKVLERDRGVCRLCGGPGNHVHHVFHRTEAEMNDHSLKHLISLCGSCHSKIHEIKVGQIDGEIVISGPIFGVLGIKQVRIVDE
jgi:5-methylcytosine-specific restriction endonuclease McrA